MAKKGNSRGGGGWWSSFKSFSLRVLGWTKRVALFFFVSTVLVTLFYRFVPVFFTPLMVIRCLEQKMDGREVRLEGDWVPITEISQNMVNAVVVSEDSKFMLHWGFDVEAIRKAMDNNRKKKGRLCGASTISQQTAKNVFLWPDRTWLRKGLETYFTVLVELLWSKERIMEVYLNVVELGDGIYGVEAASNHYFGKPARRLSASQAALLAASLPSPRKSDPAHPSTYLYKREKVLLKYMSYHGNVDLKGGGQ